MGIHSDDLTSLGGSKLSSEDDEDEENISLVWEDPKVDGIGGELVCWGDEIETLEVEPLAISKPLEEGLCEEDTATPAPGYVVSPLRVVVNPLDWVRGKSKQIGKVLGASYNGNEERVTRLLMEIDGRRPQPARAMGGLKSLKEERKGNRELKRLTCFVNYESDSAKSREKSKERVLALSQ